LQLNWTEICDKLNHAPTKSLHIPLVGWYNNQSYMATSKIHTKFAKCLPTFRNINNKDLLPKGRKAEEKKKKRAKEKGTTIKLTEVPERK
jgi:hypothetical protein